MEGSNKKSKLIVSLIILLVSFGFSVFLSHYTYNTDFTGYYYAASTILDSNAPNISVYDIDIINRYSIPEATEFHGFSFLSSMPVAYIIAPLALMPYFKAKSVMIFINILMYLAAIAIALRLGGASGRWFAYPLAILCLWWPFIHSMRHGQLNGIILCLIAIAVFTATKNHPTICGIFLAIAALFKLFPIAIAMLLGVKNWRIFASCIVAFSVSFIIPGSLKWFQALSNNLPHFNFVYTPLYLWLKQFDFGWYWIYAATVAGFSALLVYRSKNVNYPLIASFAIPSVFLVMPLLEYTHLTLLAFSYSYIVVTTKKSIHSLLIFTILSFILINTSFFFVNLLVLNIIVSFSLVVFWAALAYNLSTAPCVEGLNV